MKLKRILTVAIAAVMTLGMFSYNVANAAGTYSISCKNDAYGMQLGSDYTAAAYVYTGAAGGVSSSVLADQYIIRGDQGAYVGNDCLYAGSADTNGTAVVAGDVARLAVHYRICHHSKSKTQNDYFQLDQWLLWELKSAMAMSNSWYSGVKHLKRVKNYVMGCMFGVENNRLV